MERLLGIIENQGSMLVAAKASVEERQMDRLIREEQDIAYIEALREDQEKERREMEEKARIEEEERTYEEEKRRIEQEELSAIRKKQQILSRKSSGLPEEPRESGDGVVSLMVSLPDGTRLPRKFRKSDKVQAIYDFVDIHEPAGVEMERFSLVENFPKRVISDKSLTIGEAAIHSQTILHIQLH
eukprot:TRINITY_DN19850_c0_g1_i1.p1 TRINITY_DN19850_c0_g1~~TRINITY_DN19850_c0_g1_i1.p1  ORF type:complete len:185 (+),score=56.40 TRINITY_DN19850_c0_g1_i1:323-877(+)